MGNAVAQQFARDITGTNWQLTGDLHAYCDAMGAPAGQLAERIGGLAGLIPSVAMDILLNGTPEAIYSWIGAAAIFRRAGVTANVYSAGADGAFIYRYASGNYTDADGSTGFSAVDGSAGLVLDGMGAVGSEQATIASASFSARTGNECLSASSALANTTYIVTYDYNISVGSVQANIGNIANVTKTGVGTATVICTPTAGGAIAIGCNAATGSVSNFSVKQVTGIHATQATAGNRPSVRRGLYNQFKYANVSSGIGTDYNGMFGGVGSNGVLTANYGLAPDGTMTAARAQLSLNGGTTTADRSGVTGVGAPIDSLVRTMAVYLKSLSGSPTVLTRVHGSVVYTTLNTSTWTMVPVSGSSGADSTTNLVEIRGGQTPTNSNTADVLVWGAGLFTGTLTAQQILDSGGIPLTTSAAASNASAGRYSWQFDGTNDSLALGSVPFQTSDDHAVIAAYRTNSVGGANAAVAVLSATTGITRNCGIITETGTGKALVTWFDGVTNNQIATAASILGTPVVVSGRKVGASGVGRLNGTQFGTVTVAASLVGTVGFIGSFAGAGQEHNGNISIVIAIKGTLSDADMLTLERFAASTLPNAPSF